MAKPHAILIPYPAQGHVIPMLELALRLAMHGIKVTFVNTEFNHRRVMESLSWSANDNTHLVNMVSIPDGMEPGEDKNDLAKLTEAYCRAIPDELEALIQRINAKESGRITCLVADFNIACSLEVAGRLELRRAAFWPAAAVLLALGFNMPNLISNGIIDSKGKVFKDQQMIQLSPNIPPMSSTNLPWNCMGDDPAIQKTAFDILAKIHHAVKLTDWLLCNSSFDFEPGTFSGFPNILPVGPLLASHRLGRSIGHFWPEDSSCVAWLDQQRPESVIYVAFGSFTVFDQRQFKEVAVGLELTGRPFLWVVRQELTADVDSSYPEGFKERVGDRGRVVGWAPQQEVLSHLSVACFVSHCGWNSTIESVANGVPLLCWPYFADQFLNRTYICDEWRVGLGLDKNENGIIERGEIKEKVDRLLSDESYKERVVDLQTKVAESVERGTSCKNFSSFVDWIENNY